VSAVKPYATSDLRLQFDDDCSRAITLRTLWDVLRATPGMTVGDSDFSVYRDDARGLVMEVRAQYRGAGGRISRATLGTPPGREAWADVNRVLLSVPHTNVPEAGLAPYVEIAEQLAIALGWKVWDAQEDRYLLPRNRRPSEPPPTE
jgi:hypothetical protein